MNQIEQALCRTSNNQPVDFDRVPILLYGRFRELAVELLKKDENHCVLYFACRVPNGLRLIAAIADDCQNELLLLAHQLEGNAPAQLESLTPTVPALHVFEREIWENYGVNFIGHPWLKPVRYPHNRYDKNQEINGYPFLQADSHQLHEVGVGPIHAGIIEPGHFRFICNGENVLHLEVQLGWQHRGIEDLMVTKINLLQRTMLAEGIAGDTTVGHTLAFAQAMEALGNLEAGNRLSLERSMALELERIAIHTGDIAALCTDVAYGLGASIFGILRTGIINFTQSWCGNRLGKGMIRVGGINHPFTNALKQNLICVLDNFEHQFVELAHHTYKLPSVENRFDNIGTVTEAQMRKIGAVGMAARMAHVNRDVRFSHPFAGFAQYPITPVILPKGDVFSRFLLRRKEIKASIAWIRERLRETDFDSLPMIPPSQIALKPNTLAISMVEGWRGEIVHCAITNHSGDLSFYKIKDPSLHNWKALELSLRELEISDFPINNKSYNLSYCGHDL